MSFSNIKRMPDLKAPVESAFHYVEGFPSAYYRLYQAELASDPVCIDDLSSDDDLIRTLLTQINLGSLKEDQVNALVQKLDQIDLAAIEPRLRIKVAYSLLFPIVFPAPEVQIQNYFSDQQILKWVMSVVPEGSAVMVIENFRAEQMKPAITPILDSSQTWQANHRLLFVAEVLIMGDFKHLGVSFPGAYVFGKTRETILGDMRQIFGPLYRKELYLVAGVI